MRYDGLYAAEESQGLMAVEGSKLPPEIIGEIIGFISWNTQTLRACALVCQDWLSESRVFLFQDIYIDTPKMFNSFVSLILRSDRLRPWFGWIYHIAVHFVDHIDKTFVLEISERLPNLRTLAFGYTLPERGRPPLIDHLPALGRLALLHQLRLELCEFDSLNGVQNVLVALPSLSSLMMSYVSWADPSTPETDGLSTPDTPPTLYQPSVTSSPEADSLLCWLSHAQHILEALSLDSASLVTGLRLVGGTYLAALTVHIPGPRHPLFGNASVVELTPLVSQIADFDSGSSWPDVARVLELFASAGAVRYLRLCCCPMYHFEGGDKVELFCESLEVLDPILEDSDAFRSLCAVEFSSFFPQQPETLLKMHDQLSLLIEQKLPKLHERGIVEVYVYNGSDVLGPTSWLEHTGDPDFPHGDGMI